MSGRLILNRVKLASRSGERFFYYRYINSNSIYLNILVDLNVIEYYNVSPTLIKVIVRYYYNKPILHDIVYMGRSFQSGIKLNKFKREMSVRHSLYIVNTNKGLNLTNKLGDNCIVNNLLYRLVLN